MLFPERNEAFRLIANMIYEKLEWHRDTMNQNAKRTTDILNLNSAWHQNETHWYIVTSTDFTYIDLKKE